MMRRIWNAVLVLAGRRVAVMPDAPAKHERMKQRCRILALKLGPGGGCAGPTVRNAG
jgi:hypothetical protein